MTYFELLEKLKELNEEDLSKEVTLSFLGDYGDDIYIDLPSGSMFIGWKPLSI